MKLSADVLRGSGGFAGAPVKKSIKWEIDGEECELDVWVRRLSYKSAVTDAIAWTSDGDLPANRIAYCIVDENDKPIFSLSDVTGYYPDGTPVTHEVNGETVASGPMSDDLGNRLLEVIFEVNPTGKTRGRNSPQSKSSGTNSSSAGSAAGQSRKRRKASPTKNT